MWRRREPASPAADLCSLGARNCVRTIVRATAGRSGPEAKGGPRRRGVQLQGGKAALHAGQVAAPRALQLPHEAARLAVIHLRIQR